MSVNEEVMDNPTLINSDPYGSWFAVIGDITSKGELLSSEEYDEYIKTLK
jgi:glycine cleavage system H protein